jgi:2-dehydro-3-deoxygalactonokinase
MSPAAFIAVDWGTSNARFALCDRAGQVLEVRKGPGAADARGRFPEVLDEHTAEWRRGTDLPTVLCGMVGSTFGWTEAPYLPCPAQLGGLARSLVNVRPGAYIVPGMRCTNPLGAPDVMRGEETQLLGARALEPDMGRGRKLACLPGTHTKWASLADGTLQTFLTAPTGELFAMLCDHSVLVRDRATPITHVEADFERGLDEASRHAGADLLHRLFQARSRRLDKQLSAEGAASWTSGLLVGTDVRGALSLFVEHEPDGPIHVIGTPQLTRSYARALEHFGRRAVQVDGATAVIAGLAQLSRGLA